MERFWKEFAENDPTRKDAPDWYFWPGVALMAIAAICVVVKLLSL